MAKSSLRTVKKNNRRLILGTLLSEGVLSRIELAERTGLSPSTITALVGELVSEGIVQETGLRAATAGRSRAGLMVRADYGSVAVIDVGRSRAVLYIYNMGLQCTCRRELPQHSGDGNELLSLITDAIHEVYSAEELRSGRLMSIGLLFQDDTDISEFRVMYSTGYTAATISLSEALFTQFKVPVQEEYSRVYTVTHALEASGKPAGANYAHIDLSDRAIVRVVQQERPVMLREGGQVDITSLLMPDGDSILDLVQDYEASSPRQQAAAIQNEQSPIGGFILRLNNLAQMLCTLFIIDKIYLSGTATTNTAFVRGISRSIKIPDVCLTVLNPDPSRTPSFMATDLRQNLLCSADA